MKRTETGLIKVDQQELETLIVKLYKDKTNRKIIKCTSQISLH